MLTLFFGGYFFDEWLFLGVEEGKFCLDEMSSQGNG
jgi:hypothetical protein